jgi:hypothetical protein
VRLGVHDDEHLILFSKVLDPERVECPFECPGRIARRDDHTDARP